MLSVEERVYTLSYLWKEAAYNYAFWGMYPDLDWDKEYRDYLPQVMQAKDDFEFLCLLVRFYAILQDGHTAVTFPAGMFDAYSFPVSFEYVENKLILIGVPEGCEAHLFAELLAVNSIPTKKFIEDYVYPYFWHQKTDSLLSKNNNVWTAMVIAFHEKGAVALQTTEGELTVYLHDRRSEKKVPCTLKPTEPLQEYRSFDSCRVAMTDDEIAYITISDFYHDELVNDILSVQDRLSVCRGFLLDVRGNRGGKGAPPFHLAQLFFGGKYPVKTHFRTPSHNAQMHALEPYLDKALVKTDERQRKIYQVATHTYYEQDNTESVEDFDWFDTVFYQPVVLLTNCGTACAAEGFVDYFRMAKRGITVGSPTYGSGSEAMIRDLPLGAKMWLATTWSDLCSGEPYVNVGILPDIKKTLSLTDFQAERDTVWEEGLRVLREQIK